MAEPSPWPWPAAIRSRLILEMAAEMNAAPDEPYREAQVRLMPQHGDRHPVTLSASSTVEDIARVVSGEIDLSFVNPSSALTVAYRGKGSYFTTPQPVRAVTVVPSPDQCLLAVSATSGLTHIEDLPRAKLPLRISVRDNPKHWLHCMLEDIFRAAGFSGRDLLSWGGELRKEGKIPGPGDMKFQALARGEIDGIFDEGPDLWADEAARAGLRVLQMTEETAARLEAVGYRRAWLRRADYPTLSEDILTLDFSGWPIFVRADARDEAVTQACAGIEARKDVIPWEGTGPLPTGIMCCGGPAAPLDIPLHPAAERFWTTCGYL